MKCTTCGKRFELKSENRYEVVVGGSSLIDKISLIKPTTYNAFDCPKCGCQNLVSIKETDIINNTAGGEISNDEE